MKIYTLLLEDWTIGKTFSQDTITVGDIATVQLADENGNPISVTDKVMEILAEEDLA